MIICSFFFSNRELQGKKWFLFVCTDYRAGFYMWIIIVLWTRARSYTKSSSSFFFLSFELFAWVHDWVCVCVCMVLYLKSARGARLKTYEISILRVLFFNAFFFVLLRSEDIEKIPSDIYIFTYIKSYSALRASGSSLSLKSSSSPADDSAAALSSCTRLRPSSRPIIG